MLRNLGYVLFITLFVSCNVSEDNPVDFYKSNYIGTPGEVLIVMDDKYWESDLGLFVRENISPYLLYFPKPETQFNLIHRSKKDFTGKTKDYINVVEFIKNPIKGPEARMTVDTSFFATNQLYIKLYGNNAQELADLFAKNTYKIRQLISDYDQYRLLQKFDNERNKDISTYLISHYNMDISVPSDMKLILDDSNFVVLAREKKRTSNIENKIADIQEYLYIYTYPYIDSNTFSESYLIDKRNAYLKKYIKGSVDSSYMTTQEDIDSISFTSKEERLTDSNYVFILRGLYKMVNDFRGGPFESFTFYDEKNKRIVTIEGNVFAPAFRKQEFMLELEAMISSLKFL